MVTATKLSSDEKTFQETLVRLRTRQATVCVIGLGYVGLPLVRLIARAGFSVLGFDCDPAKIERLNARKTYIKHIADEEIEDLFANGKFTATDDTADLKQADALIICVPTPLSVHRDPDLSFVEATARNIRDHLRPGQLVVLESTTYPGTLRQVVQPILEESGLTAGEDFFLAFSPEREDPGNPTHSAAFIPKVVGGLEPKSHELAVALYEPLVPQVVSVESPEIAEACKILENTYRCVNIALVNELKMLFERMGIDVWKVIEAAKTKPFGFQAFYPGPGLGGHCIPIDPFYLSWIARKFDTSVRFIELAGEVNTAMPEYVVQRVQLALNSVGKPARGTRICICGMAYKKDVDDCREAPGFELLERLMELGAEVFYNDPYFPKLPRTRRNKIEMESQELTPRFLRSLDCLIVATDHSCYDWKAILKDADLVVDTRNATALVPSRPNQVWRA